MSLLVWRRTTCHRSAAAGYVLSNPIYSGLLVTGMRSEGKFFVLKGNEPERRKNPPKTESGEIRVVWKPESDWIKKEGAVEPLIDQALFDRVQARLAQAKRPPAETGRRSWQTRRRRRWM